ncbi:TniQ family protein, partial [Hydrogenophaga sp. OTU3427]|uniref:TniQ family protein n=1 Tax=Hydrogenophaga sp. OTU3427 TaxID=3043856 RepID=UPI00313D9523
MVAKLAYIPGWRSDETLYSWISSFHAVHGNGSARDTGALLFDSEHACRDRDAPRNMHHFVDVTNFALGDIESLLFTRTPIGLFIPFLLASRRQKLYAQLESRVGPGWRLLWGMPASGLHDNSAMYYCEDCIKEDMITWGLPRWRLPHQLPGAWVCLEHEQQLRTLRTNASQWVLPPLVRLQNRLPQLEAAQGEMLNRIARLSLQVARAGVVDVASVRQAILLGLREHGVTSWLHPLDKSHLTNWFSHSPVAEWLRRSEGPWQWLASGEWIHDLLRNRVGDHPLKWMILWSTLFADQDVAISHSRFMDPVSSPSWEADGQATVWGATP